MFKRLLPRGKVAKNAGWLIAGKLMHALLSFAVSLVMARYLGPANYGLINYAAAYTTFFASICTLGINSVIVKEYFDKPDEEGESLGTSLVLRMASSAMSALTIIGIVCVIDRNEPLTKAVVALYSLSLLFQVFENFNTWFQAKLQSKYTAIATMLAYAAASAYKIALLVLGKDVRWFAVATSVDAFFVALVLFIAYHRFHGSRLRFSWRKAKSLLNRSRYYILSGLMISIYGCTDRLMLKQMLDEASVGYYSMAVSVSNIWTFLLSAIIDSIKPVIIEKYNTDRVAFRKYNSVLYSLVFYLSLAVSCAYMLAGDWLIVLFYGESYAPAIAPMRVITWYVAFSYLGVARDTWIVCENKQRYLGGIYMGSALINVVLNLLLIPHWGAVGAAAASLATQFSTIFVFPLLIKDLRPNVQLIWEAITLKEFREGLADREKK